MLTSALARVRSTCYGRFNPTLDVHKARMLATFAVTVPFFALVLLGYLAARRGMLSNAAIPGMNVFLLYFALPCALFRFGMSTPLLQLLSPGVLAIYSLCALLMIAVTVAMTRRDSL